MKQENGYQLGGEKRNLLVISFVHESKKSEFWYFYCMMATRRTDIFLFYKKNKQ